MKSKKFTRLSSALLSLLMVFSLIPAQTALAASNTLYVTPATQTVRPGDSFTISVKGAIAGNSFTGISGVSGTLSFPASLLQVTAATTSGATFNFASTATTNNAAGTIGFSGQLLGAVDNRDVHVMTVTFRALANGTANVGLSGSTYRSILGNVAAALSGGVYTIATPPATCPSGQVGTPPNCTTPPVTTPTTPTKPTTPSTPKTTTPTTPSTPTTPTTPTITPEQIIEEIKDPEPESEFSISNVTASRNYTTASLIWRTSAASTATVTYGSSLKSLDKKAETTKQADESYEASFKDLVPGKQYYYTISAASDADTTKTDTYSGIFTTRGYPVVISVTQNGEPASSAKLTIGEQNYSTDKSGKVSLELASGSYQLEAKTKDGSKKFTLAVAKKNIPEDGGAPETQRFTFDVAAAVGATQNNNLMLLIIGLIIGGLLLFGFLFWLWRRRQNQDAQPSVVISDQAYTQWSPPEQYAATPQAYADAQPQAATTFDAPIQPQEQYAAAMPIEQQPYQEPVPAAESFTADQPQQPAVYDEPLPAASPTDDGIVPTNLQDILPNVPADPQLPPTSDVATQPPVQPLLDTLPPSPEMMPTQIPDASYATPLEPAAPQPVAEQPITEPQAPTEEPPVQTENYSDEPESEVIQTPTGTELQINHHA